MKTEHRTTDGGFIGLSPKCYAFWGTNNAVEKLAAKVITIIIYIIIIIIITGHSERHPNHPRTI